MDTNKCPFKAGDIVIYNPTTKGRGGVIMTELAGLVPGNKYRIARISNDVYVVVEGLEDSAAGGLHWTEFEAA